MLDLYFYFCCLVAGIDGHCPSGRLPLWQIQGGSKKVSCCTVSTAYFFEPPCKYSFTRCLSCINQWMRTLPCRKWQNEE